MKSNNPNELPDPDNGCEVCATHGTECTECRRDREKQEANEEFLAKALAFSKAADALSEAWPSQFEGATDYPFAESFDETILRIDKWTERIYEEVHGRKRS